MIPSQLTDSPADAVLSILQRQGAATIKEMHRARMIIAPSIKTEGKFYQSVQICT